MLFKIAKNIFNDYPGLKIGIVLAININNEKENKEIEELFKKTQKKIKDSFTTKNLGQYPFILSWRDAYRKFGAKPKDHLSSIENLTKKILDGGELKSVNNLVDIYNMISLKYLIPAGGEDLDTIKGDIQLTLANENEPKVKLLGEKEERSPLQGEVIYKDEVGALVRRWNWKEAERTKLTKQTKNAFFVLEGLPPITDEIIKTATNELANLIKKYCEAEVSFDLLDEKHNEVELKKDGKFIKLNPTFEHFEISETLFKDSTVHSDNYQPSQEHQIRVNKVEQMRKLGIEPWPDVKMIDSHTEDILKQYTPEIEGKEYVIAGRVMSLRWHGKSAFANIQDVSGKIQVYFKLDLLGEAKFDFLQKFVDIGDILWIKGDVFKTKAGEITLKVHDFTMESKCLHPLPDKFHGIEDTELKYRQRYLDLITSQESRDKFRKRSALMSSMRNYLEKDGYIEVETPMLQPIAGGAVARPFITHHNALDSDFYLRIAPELYLKRLVVGGFEKVFEINRNFRNEGISTRHNPEFTMIEFYTANVDYKYIMNYVETMLRSVIKQSCNGNLQLPFGSNLLDFEKPFTKISIKDSVLKYLDLNEKDLSADSIDKILQLKNVFIQKENASVNEKIYALFENFVEQKLIQPTFVTDFPAEISPLAKRDPNNPEIAARFELYIAGMELSNGYNELNDPFIQAEIFKEQAKARSAGDVEAHFYDADYVTALEYGLAPTAGVGIGIDRLIMLITDTTSIKDVILFPTLKKR